MANFGNRILCDECFRKLGPHEEKTCTHGLMVGATCVDCGKVRKDWHEKPAFHCLGGLEAK